ncbi:MAG: HlyD family efflux transporter periplasmic adaptor subunit [Lachnospiraceae bacterium]|nr:HlyD family efflux transporter periplasmic adaptor subunit [Lachnospiraceae bacterium]
MEEKNTTKRREWVKNAAIIFLTIMLLLTFFSNTIMNYSLPEVATQYVQTGTITAKVRGTGKVEASDPYNVIAKESRVITSVAVKQGDIVEKDQVIYYLEESESDELTKAEQELEDLELNYMKGLFGANVSPEVITKVANGNIDSFSQLQAKVTDMQNRLEAAKKRVEECQKNVDDLTLQSTKDTNNAGVSTKNDELNRDLATADLTEAQNRFEKDKAATIASLNAQITELTSQISDLEKLLSNAEASAGSSSTSSSTSYDGQRKKAIESLKKTVNVILKGLSKSELGDAGLTEIENAYKGVYDAIKDNKDYQTLIADYNATHMLIDNIEQNAKDVNNLYANNQTLLSKKKADLANLQKQLAEVQAITASSDGGVQDAQNRLNQANRNILEITTANSQTSVAWQNRLADANAALKNAQAVYDLLKEEQTSLAADINAELDLSKTNKDIQKKKEEIEKLKEKSMGSAVKAPVAGTITTVKYVAGETTQPEDVMAVIQPEGKGFTLSISVTNEQAKKVQIGDMAELQNSWYYDDARVMLSAIKPDPDNPGTNKLLVFDVSGSTIQADQSLSISVGQRSQEYELVVPNSAIREDNDGKFILTVESKSSPLGNRYIATRVGVEVLASDDNNSAISAPLYGWEYVITTSTKPVEAGKQVRLADNS